MLSALVPALPFLWLGIFFLAPFLIVLKISLSDPAVAQPPYRPLFAWSDLAEFFGQLDLENFTTLVSATISTCRRRSRRCASPPSRPLLLLLIGFPIAYAMARAPARHRGIAGRAGDPAVLDELPDPHLRLDRRS